MKKFDIIVRGGYGLTNFGDDALLRSIHNDYLQGYSKKELAYSSTQASYLKKDIDNYNSLSLDIKYNELTKILIFGGGTQFYSFYRKKNFFERILSNLDAVFNPKKIKNGIKRIIARKRNFNKHIDNENLSVMALGVGVGPFLKDSDPRAELQTKELFKSMEFVAVRDRYSYQKCQEWGVENYSMYADLCFKMKHRKFFKESSSHKIKKLGIIVRDWDKTDAGKLYKNSLLNAANKIKQEDNVDVYFIVFAKAKDPEWIKTIKSKNEKFLLWDPDNCSIDEFFEILSDFDFFITARYHGAVFSAMLGKPFITIAIEQKLSMISDVFSAGSYNWTYPFNPENLIDNLKKINLNYKNHSNEIAQEALKQRDLANKMSEDLNTSLKKVLNK